MIPTIADAEVRSGLATATVIDGKDTAGTRPVPPRRQDRARRLVS